MHRHMCAPVGFWEKPCSSLARANPSGQTFLAECRTSVSTMSAVRAPPLLTRCPRVQAATSIVMGSVVGWNSSRRYAAKFVVFAASSPRSWRASAQLSQTAHIGQSLQRFLILACRGESANVLQSCQVSEASEAQGSQLL